MVGVARHSKGKHIIQSEGGIPRMARIDSLILAWRYLLPTQAVVLHIIDDLKGELNQKSTEDGIAENAEAPHVIHNSKIYQLSEFHEEDLIQ